MPMSALAAQGLRERRVAGDIDEEHGAAKRRTGRRPVTVVGVLEALEERPCDETLEAFHGPLFYRR